MVDVTTIYPGTVFAYFMLGKILRRVVLIAIFNIAGYGKPFQPGTRVPEDDSQQRKRVESSTTEPPQVEFTMDARVNKTITNDAENDTYFLILLLTTASFSDSVSGNVIQTIVYGVFYLFIRICYAVAYIEALQSWRTILFATGLTCIVACNLDLVITMYRRSN
jgi:uncharacterized MAPEG superfamily protein